MSVPSKQISTKTKNCSFTNQSIDKFLALLATQQPEYFVISYKANGPFTLVLGAKKNDFEVALKVLECTDHTDSQIQAMEREYAMLKQLPSSDYFIAIYNQFFLTEINENMEQSSLGNSNSARNVYFVQSMEMCEGSLDDNIKFFSEKNKDLPSEAIKELLAIQMLDAVNILHQRNIAHGNITAQNFLVSSSQEYQILLKLCNHRFQCPVNLRNLGNYPLKTENESMSEKSLMVKIQRQSIEYDLISLGKVLLQLDNNCTNLDYSTVFNFPLAQPDSATKNETHQINHSTLLYRIASLLMGESRENSLNVRDMLVLLLQKQTKGVNIPLFSIVLKIHVNSFRLLAPSNRKVFDCLVLKMNRQHKLHSTASWFNDKGQRKTQLTVNLVKRALKIMMEWKEFSDAFDVLGVGADCVVFGVENLMQNRKSALKLSLCTNKAETIREIGLRRICQSPYMVKFYQHKFFNDDNGNEFVVFELERCKYSLTHHLELQRIYGEYSEEQKYVYTLQMISSVSFLHENRILHRNIKLDSFLITDNGQGQTVVKLGNFRSAVQLLNNFQKLLTLENQILKHDYQSPINCILQIHKMESLLYFAPERWENPDLSTFSTDSFSVGLCIFLLDNWLACSEEQLAQLLLQVSFRSTESFYTFYPQISTKVGLQIIANPLLIFQPEQRKTLMNLTQNLAVSQNKNFFENYFQQHFMLTIENQKVLDDLKQEPLSFSSLYSIQLNLGNIQIEANETKSILDQISNLLNLTRISLNFTSQCIFSFGDKCVLSPLSRLINLQSVYLNLKTNSIGEKQAQSLLSPLANLISLTNLSLDLQYNMIENNGNQSILSPLANLLDLSSLALNLDYNQIGDKGAQSLLFPLENLLNLSSLSLCLNRNQIGRIGIQYLLKPLANLVNISNLALHLNFQKIGYIGVQFLLSPLMSLRNITTLALDLSRNEIGDVGAQSLLSPLENFINLSSLALNVNRNQIGDLGAQLLLTPLGNLLNLSSLDLNLNFNKISNIGAQSLLSSLKNLLNLSSLTINLEYNQIRDTGAQSLLYPLKNLFNISILNLDLTFNQIGQKGVQSLLFPLENQLNLSTLSLHLRGNKIQEIELQSLFYSISNMTYLSSVFLDMIYLYKYKQTKHLFNNYLKKIKFITFID